MTSPEVGKTIDFSFSDTEAEVGVLYDLHQESSACLVAAGYPVAPMQSRETWIQQYLALQDTGRGSPALPWDAIRDRANAEAQQVCLYPSLDEVYARLDER